MGGLDWGGLGWMDGMGKHRIDWVDGLGGEMYGWLDGGWMDGCLGEEWMMEWTDTMD